MSKVLIVSAHPDDEIIGAGGTLFKHKERGDQLFWLIITNVFEHQGFSKERVLSRQKEIQIVSQMVGFEKVYQLSYPTMTLTFDSIIDMVPKISEVFNDAKPAVIYCLNRSDIHSDHRIVFQSVMACTKSFRYPFIKTVLMYECISETEFAPALPENSFIPNYFVDISDFMQNKLDALTVYASEIANHPFPRSIDNIKALAHFRGATCGVVYAEAFQLLKHIDK
jgi:LmbE family N-acetylglucosaminyl deacetylase